MDMAINSPHSESGRLEQIVSQFLLKSLHIILDSRIPSFRSNDRVGETSSNSRAKKSDKWFSLVLGDRRSSLDNLNFWHRNLMDPMIIDIILVQQGPERASVETVIERWVAQFESPRGLSHQSGESSPASCKRTYKKSIILLRSLYSMMRFLPAYKIFQKLRYSNQSYSFDIVYKVSSFSEPFGRSEEEVMKEYTFVPVEALPGSLCVSVLYHPTPLNFDLEVSASMPTKIIMDYVGSPATDPLRSLPSSSDKGFNGVSYPLRGTRVPTSSSPFQRPHSWSSGFQREPQFSQNQLIGGSPPTYRASLMPYDPPSPSPPDIYGHRFYNSRPPSHQNSMGFDEYQLSPPFSSSASPSPPTYNFSGNTMQSRFPRESAPVTIPMSPISRYLSPNSSDSGRHSLPPPSPRSKLGHSSQDYPCGIQSLRKMDSLKVAEAGAGGSNHYISQKTTRDSKEDSGRFSGLLSSSDSPCIGFSRSSSRVSFQDDLDDYDFSCPFDVDDVDVSISNASQNIDGRKGSEYSSHHLLMGRKSQSQDAAVGVLVHMLKTAPPLRQDLTYSSHSTKIEPEGETGSASAFFMPRKATDALEELRSYKDLKDLLLSKSGTQLIKNK